MVKGGYNQRIKTLSENNKSLVDALENYKSLYSAKEKSLIQVSTAALQNSISAKAKLSKLAKDLKQILLSVEELITFMNTNSSDYPTMFVQNRKQKETRDCLSKLIESISEETACNWDDFPISKPCSSLGKTVSSTEKGSTAKPSASLIPIKRSGKNKSIRQKIQSIQEQNKEKVLEPSSDLTSDFHKPHPSNKRCKNSNEVELPSQMTRKKRKSNPLCRSNKTIKKNLSVNLHSPVDKIIQDPVINVINSDHSHANLQNLTEEKLQAADNITDKANADIGVENIKVKSVSKANKTNRQTKKNCSEKLITANISSRSRKTKFLTKPLKLQFSRDENKSEANIKVTSFEGKENSFEESCASEILDSNNSVLQEPKERRKQSQNKPILCSVENIPSVKAKKTTVAEIHKPPSSKLTEKKAFPSNASFKIMQPCVVLTDICETSLLIESEDNCFVQTPSLKFKNKECREKETKFDLTNRSIKIRGSEPSLSKTSRMSRSKPAICYKEACLNKKMRRS